MSGRLGVLSVFDCGLSELPDTLAKCGNSLARVSSVSLCLLSCRVLSCLVLSFVLSCLVLSCLVVSCLVLSFVLSCLVVSCPYRYMFNDCSLCVLIL